MKSAETYLHMYCNERMVDKTMLAVSIRTEMIERSEEGWEPQKII